jgi:PhzF family phenazine biosynthesis protein
VPREAVIAHSWCDNGPPWRAVMLPSAADVLALRPDRVMLDGQFVGVVGAREPGAECAFEVRAFFPGHEGLVEDPVTGSLNAALARWLIGAGLGPDRYVAAQGTALGRAGRVHVERDAGGETWIGGESITCISGHVTL